MKKLLLIIPLIILLTGCSEAKRDCYIVKGEVLTQNIIQPSSSKRWASTTGKARIINENTIVKYYSRPNNIYDVGDIIEHNTCRINQELFRNHD